MESGRSLKSQPISRLILNKKFGITKEVDVGNTGQLRLRGTVEAERLGAMQDSEEQLIKTIYVKEAELIINKPTRL